MKKGFTMIELIFVIVILGILASVAIPRLAATREDAEISTTIANLRALISEVSSYYVGHGKFTTGTANTGVPWNEITNVPLKRGNGNDIVNTDLATTEPAGTTNGNGAYLAAGKKACIGVQLVNRTIAGGVTTPAHIKFTRHTANASDPVCSQVLASEAVTAYLTSTSGGAGAGTVAVGSSRGIYAPPPAPQPSTNGQPGGTSG